jgi:hypothetical protein
VAIVVAATITVAAALFILLYFEPQKLFLDDEVKEPLPAMTGADTRELARGEFRGLEHSASGRALLIEVGGERYLRFEDLDTSNGPDLRVYLSTARSGSEEDTFDDDYVELGDLKGNVGDQNYEIPESTDLSRFRSAVVWCKRFSAGFAVAPIETRS